MPDRVGCAVWVPVGVGFELRVVVGVGLDDRVTAALRDRECVLEPERDAPWDRERAAVRVGEGDRVFDVDRVADGVPTPDGVGVPVPAPVGDGVGWFLRTATLRLRMVALDTPASLASQE